MATISAADVAKLRRVTLAGMMDCKKALEEADGNFDKAIEIIEKYRNAYNSFLFPILSHLHYTEQQRANRVHKFITKVNCKLKEIGKELQIPIDLTTYVARHSFATVLKRAGVNTSLICESLGHSSEKVTQIYLDSFENSQIDEALKNLL